MKCYTKHGLAVIILTVSVCAHAQVNRKNSFGISAGIGGGVVIQQASEGGGSMDLKTGVSLALTYYRSIAPKASFETGLVFYSNRLIFDPPFNPNFNFEEQTENVRMLYIPIFIRFDVSKTFFLQGGFLADLDFTKSEYMDDLSGIGFGIGFGFYIPLSEKIKLQINPFTNLHGLASGAERLLETGIRFGVRTY